MTMATTAAADESALDDDDADAIPALRSQIDALDEAITGWSPNAPGSPAASSPPA